MFFSHRILSACAVGALAAAVPALAQTATAPRSVPLTETIHGITLSDEYRWMEDPANKAEMAAYVAAQSQRTRAMLDALPVRAELVSLFGQASSGLARQCCYQSAGGTELYLRTLRGEQTSRLVKRAGGATTVLVDPSVATGNALSAIGAFSLSPDGKTVAVQMASGGEEIGSVRFFDTASGKETYPAIPNMWSGAVPTFLPGGLISYSQLAEKPIDGDALKGMTAWIRPLAGGAATKVMGYEMAELKLAQNDLPFIDLTPLSPFAIGVAAGARADGRIFIAPQAGYLASKPQWQEVAGYDEKIASVAMLGNRLFSITAKNNSARDLIVQTVDAAGRAGPAKLLMKGNDQLILTEVHTARDGVYALATTDGVARVFFLPGGGAKAAEVKLPFEGTAGAATTSIDGRTMTLGMTGWARNGSFYRVSGGKLTSLNIDSPAWAGASNLAVDRYEAVSADGTKVPLVVTRLKGSTGRIPTLVEAYGGYGIDTSTPFYNRMGMAFIAKGGAMAYCGVRGGGERGRAWHEGGRGPNKPRGQEDLIACAETLTAKGLAPAQGPVATGSSMAGALVPGAVLRKPSAFGGLITRVGVVNASRIGVAENGANQFAEMGDPANAQQFKDLVAMDAYQIIPAASTLPPTMMVIGMNDRRVAPWMTAKWVARAQAKWPGAPIWLRSDDKAGHGMGSTEDVRRDEWSDIFAFAWANQQLK